MDRQSVLSERAPQPIGPYSQAIRVGPWLFLSGQIALDPQSGELDKASVAAETARVLENLSAVLGAAGARLEHVLKTTVYLTDMADFAEFNQAYARAFPGSAPARSTVAVRALPRGARVEIDAIALVPGGTEPAP